MKKNNHVYSGIAYRCVFYSLALAQIKILIIKYLILSSCPLLSYVLRHQLTLYSYFISEVPYGMHTYIAFKHQPINEALRARMSVWTQVKGS